MVEFNESELGWLEVLADAEDDPPVFRQDLLSSLSELIGQEPSLVDLRSKIHSLSFLETMELMATISLRQTAPSLPGQDGEDDDE